MSTSPEPTVSGGYTRLGTRGLYVQFDAASPGNQLTCKDEFLVICSGPLPSAYNITSLNYGNVTVSTESPIKVVQFEVESGAVEISTVKFGLEDRGNFNWHHQAPYDTRFRWGTVGVAPWHGGTGTNNGIEFPTSITADNLSAGTTLLYETLANLEQVTNADESKLVGSFGLVSNPIWLCIKLGASETGANSAINHRLYFDYS